MIGTEGHNEIAMSDSNDSLVEPTPPVRAAAPVRPVTPEPPATPPVPPVRTAPVPVHAALAAVTAGNLRAAYAEYVVNPNTHDTVIRVRDAVTGKVLSETPSPEMEQMVVALKKYSDTLNRYRATPRNGSAT
jgi:hypothetical protein